MLYTPYQSHFRSDLDAVAVLQQGETVTVATPSVLTDGRLPRTYEDLVIPVVGPFVIEGAVRGQALMVTIQRVDVADEGAMICLPGYGVFGDEISSPGGRIVPVKDGVCEVLTGVNLQSEPMVGKLGVGVPGDAPRSNTVGRHGGNMDCSLVRAGAQAIFPVLADGGYLYLGDIHALQGDGECLMTAVEIEARVAFQVTLLSGVDARRPVIVLDDSVHVVGDGSTLDEASQSALKEMHRLLRESQGWSVSEAAMFLSAAAKMNVCQVVNPRRSVHVGVPSRYLPAFSTDLDANLRAR